MSLIREIKNDIKSKYPDVYEINNDRLVTIQSLVSKSSFWHILALYLFCILLVILYSLFINFKCFQILSINFEDNIKVFTTGVITLVSMNLFVTNLLFTHLKEERDEIQTVIDRRINFKFITYLGFSIIISILLLYFISPTVNNNDIKTNILIFIFLSFLIYIFLLVDLYTTVFEFIHKSKRRDIVRKELEKEFMKAFYYNCLRIRFKERYTHFIKDQKGFISHFYFGEENLHSISFCKKKDKYLIDIDLKKLETELANIDDKEKKYLSLELNQKFPKQKSHDILLFSTKHRGKILNSYIFRNSPLIDEEFEYENIDRLIKKMNLNTLENKFESLEDNLEDLLVVYLKYINLTTNE